MPSSERHAVLVVARAEATAVRPYLDECGVDHHCHRQGDDLAADPDRLVSAGELSCYVHDPVGDGCLDVVCSVALCTL